jgi:hypothetical protein
VRASISKAIHYIAVLATMSALRDKNARMVDVLWIVLPKHPSIATVRVSISKATPNIAEPAAKFVQAVNAVLAVNARPPVPWLPPQAAKTLASTSKMIPTIAALATRFAPTVNAVSTAHA